MTLDELKAAVTRGLAWAKKSGVEVVAGEWGNLADGCGCALSCAYWAGGGEEERTNESVIRSATLLSLPEIWDFVSGFDGEKFGNGPLYDLGVEFRKEVFG